MWSFWSLLAVTFAAMPAQSDNIAQFRAAMVAVNRFALIQRLGSTALAAPPFGWVSIAFEKTAWQSDLA